MSITVKALQKTGPDQPFRVAEIDRRDPRPDDVVIDIKAAGICHSDIHTIRNEWGEASFPLTVGHEIAGVVSAVGSESPTGRSATAWVWAVSSTRAANAPNASPARSRTASSAMSARTTRPTSTGRSRRAVTRRRSSSTNGSSSASPTASTSTSPPRCCARASQHTRRSTAGVPASSRTASRRRSRSSASAVSDTWACRSPRPWAPTSPCSPGR